MGEAARYRPGGWQMSGLYPEGIEQKRRVDGVLAQEQVLLNRIASSPAGGGSAEQGGTLMTDQQESPLARLHREEVERLRGRPMLPPELPTIHLPEEPADATLATEWQTFRQEVARLLAEGQRGRFALVKAGHPLTVWDTLADAARAGRLLFGTEPCLVQEIQPFLRPLRVEYNRPCRA